MAAALVQFLGAGDTATVGTSFAITVSKTVTVGDTIIVGATYVAASGASSFADNLGNVYTADATGGNGTTERVVMFSAPVTVGGTLTTLTFTHPSATYRAIEAAEWSGVGSFASSGGATNSASTTVTWVVSGTIPANGVAVGFFAENNVKTVTAGANSGTPSTAIVLDDNHQSAVSGISTSYLHAIAGSTDVTTFTGTATLSASDTWWAGGAIYNPAATVPVWVSPADTASMGTTPVLVLTSPASGSAQHFELQLDTANTFSTGNLRDIRTDLSQTGWEYWNGTAWTAFPSTGLASTYAGNQVRHTVQSALSATTWYRQVRAGV